MVLVVYILKLLILELVDKRTTNLLEVPSEKILLIENGNAFDHGNIAEDMGMN
jgi:hypothetical protein